MKFVLIFIFFCSGIGVGYAQKYVDLRSLEWQFKGEEEKSWLPVYYFDVHLDLFANGRITEPFYQDNEKDLEWIETKNWEYKTIILFSHDEIESQGMDLIFEGLDTYADVYVNGTLISSTNNMFRKWRFNVKPYLRIGINEIYILFKSPLNVNKTQVSKANYELPSANESVKIKVGAYTRKAAYQFGWDWGPRFVTSGIWKPCYFKTVNSINIENSYVSTLEITAAHAKMKFECDATVLDQGATYSLQFMNVIQLMELDAGHHHLSFKFDIENPKLWNPIGYGNPHLYSESLTVSKKGEVVLEEFISFGIRKIQLINQPDSIGTSFYFKVNGNDFFAKGANYIPQDLFLNRVTTEHYDRLIQQVVDANMNFIRVWAGGVYEQDYFYELCDKNGILVWQDFMFANSMYPNDVEFLENVEQELIDNVKALRNHPCLALWCGNNEIEVAWKNWGWQKQYNYSPADSTEIWENYLHIFHEMIPKIVNDLSPLTSYVPTTPMSNWGKSENFNHSTMHYWGVWHGGDNIEEYANNVGRFMAEYGYQSFPSYETLQKVILEENLIRDNSIMQHRQKSYIGNSVVIENVLKYAYDEKNFREWILLSQLVQAHAMGLAIRSHRAASPHCMGTVFWQLNDCWPGPSWSVIDYYGNPKEAYAEVSKYYQPVILHLGKDDKKSVISIISDRQINPNSTSLQMKLMNNERKLIFIQKETVSLNALETHTIPLNWSKRIEKKWQKGREGWMLSLTLTEENKVIFSDTIYPKYTTTIAFPKN